jgi:hemerythrin-like domain-containing protein
MLRDKSLIPLSHQHQHALALCVRLDRALQAGEVDPAAWRSEIRQLYEQEISLHFAAEEAEIFPAAERIESLRELVEELRKEHGVLRKLFSSGELDRAGLEALARQLPLHIRKEERQLFEAMQQSLTPEELAAIGVILEKALREAAAVCIVPGEATRIRPKSGSRKGKI